MQTDEVLDQTDDATTERPGQVEVRRNLWLALAIAVGAGTMAALFCLRALDSGAPLDWAAVAVLALIAVVHLAAIADGRAPLLVADRTGVRLRHGAQWQGVGWAEVECMEHLPRRPLRDGHLLVIGRDGEQLVVPLTWATRLVGARPATVSDALAALADGRTDVVEVVPQIAGDAEDEAESTAEIARLPRSEDDTAPDPSVADTPEDEGSAPTADDADDADDPGPDAPEDPDAPDGRTDEERDDPADAPELEPDDVATGEFEPVRAEAAAGERTRPSLISSLIHRTGRSRSVSAPTAGATALQADPHSAELPEATALRRVDDEDEFGLAGVRVVQQADASTDENLTVVLDDLRVVPATEPEIGPELRTAREKLRLSIDQLADRTRIRPHVLEALEEDDFAPCGGDFYARGHLRTLARVLGLDSGPLVATYDERYADAPVDPRRVFESELASGSGSAIRGTRGGRNWSVLVAAIMAAVLVWSVARLVMDGPVPIGDTPVLNQSGGIGGAAATAETVPVTLTAPSGGAKVVVRDGGGDIVYDGNLAFGQTMQLDVEPPVRISSSDGSVTASLEDADARPLGETGEDASKVLVP